MGREGEREGERREGSGKEVGREVLGGGQKAVKENGVFRGLVFWDID